jgi:hypothetical protein
MAIKLKSGGPSVPATSGKRSKISTQELAKIGAEFDALRIESSAEAEKAGALVRDIGTKLGDYELLESLDGSDEFLSAAEEALLAHGKFPVTPEELIAIEERIRNRPIVNTIGSWTPAADVGTHMAADRAR